MGLFSVKILSSHSFLKVQLIQTKLMMSEITAECHRVIKLKNSEGKRLAKLESKTLTKEKSRKTDVL